MAPTDERTHLEFRTDRAEWTAALAINKKDKIVGSFEDADSQVHGFVRNVDGRIVTIDAPARIHQEAIEFWSSRLRRLTVRP